MGVGWFGSAAWWAVCVSFRFWLRGLGERGWGLIVIRVYRRRRGEPAFPFDIHMRHSCDARIRSGLYPFTFRNDPWRRASRALPLWPQHSRRPVRGQCSRLIMSHVLTGKDALHDHIHIACGEVRYWYKGISL